MFSMKNRTLMLLQDLVFPIKNGFRFPTKLISGLMSLLKGSSMRQMINGLMSFPSCTCKTGWKNLVSRSEKVLLEKLIIGRMLMMSKSDILLLTIL